MSFLLNCRCYYRKKIEKSGIKFYEDRIELKGISKSPIIIRYKDIVCYDVINNYLYIYTDNNFYKIPNSPEIQKISKKLIKAEYSFISGGKFRLLNQADLFFVMILFTILISLPLLGIFFIFWYFLLYNPDMPAFCLKDKVIFPDSNNILPGAAYVKLNYSEINEISYTGVNLVFVTDKIAKNVCTDDESAYVRLKSIFDEYKNNEQ